MRRVPTEAERTLWLALRGRRFLAWKFRRQVPVGPYIADFLCFEARLIVEVDGGQHAENVRDVVRDRWFEENGFRVLRLWNHEVLKSKSAALDAIFAALSEVGVEGGSSRQGPAPSSAPSGHLLPRGEKGEGEARANAITGAPLEVGAARLFVEGKRNRSQRTPSLLPSREKVAAKRSDEGARGAQPETPAKRSDEGAREAQPETLAKRSDEGAREAQRNSIRGRDVP
jgi:very-short-patch-repair endonuclease